ncbi:MAG: hypothetical protein WA432_02515 [Candidatus Babeliaceae bacterium]
MFDTYLRFLPITAFVIIFRWFNNWQYAFLVGAILSLLQILFFLYKKLPFNRFVLAINLFLLTGGLSIFCDITPILLAYERLEQTAVFIWLCIVGLITTICTTRGFINVEIKNNDHKNVFLYSLILFIATVLATICSWLLHYNYLASTVIPFVALILLQIYLTKRYYHNHAHNAHKHHHKSM